VRRRHAAAVLALFLAGLTVSVGWTTAKAARRIQKAYLYGGESTLDQRTREFGGRYTQEIEAIRGLIPRDGVYVLVAGDDAELGGAIWAHFDLAPRRAVYLGFRKNLHHPVRLRRRIPPEAHWAVIGHAEGPPELISVPQLLAEAEEHR
jgi:hypothetical protein